MVTFAILFCAGLFAGISGSLVGLGGGFIVIPALAFLFPGMPPAHLAGTSMAMLLLNSISSATVYVKQRRVDYKAAFWFAATALPGSVLGAVLVERIEGKTFFASFGIFLLSISLLLLFRPNRPVLLPFRPTVVRSLVDATGSRFDFAYHLPTGAAVSFFVGILSSLFGVGGGSLMMPTMTLLLHFPPHIAIATSMVQICLAAAVSTSTHAYLLNIEWLKLLPLAPGAFLGGQIGARLAKRLSGEKLMKALAAMLILVALRLVLKP